MIQRELFTDPPVVRPEQTWEEIALETVRSIAFGYLAFTTDEFWVAMPVHTPKDQRRRLGPIMNHAEKLGWIAKTGQYKTSKGPSNNGRPVAVWRSNIVVRQRAVA